MKIYSLMYHNYDDTHLVGVFLSREKAQEEIDRRANTDLWCTYSKYNKDYFDIDEWDVE